MWRTGFVGRAGIRQAPSLRLRHSADPMASKGRGGEALGRTILRAPSRSGLLKILVRMCTQRKARASTSVVPGLAVRFRRLILGSSDAELGCVRARRTRCRGGQGFSLADGNSIPVSAFPAAFNNREVQFPRQARIPGDGGGGAAVTCNYTLSGEPDSTQTIYRAACRRDFLKFPKHSPANIRPAQCGKVLSFCFAITFKTER